MTVVLIHIPTFLNSSRRYSFRISLPASHQSSKNMRTTPRTQTLFLFREGSGRSLHTSRVGSGYLASVSACRPRAQKDEHLLSPGSREPRAQTAQSEWPQPQEERVKHFQDQKIMCGGGPPKRAGGCQASGTDPTFSLIHSALHRRTEASLPQTCPYLRAPPPSSPRTPGAMTAKKTQSRPAAPMPRRQPQRRDALQDTRASGSSGRAGLKQEAAESRGTGALK